MRLESLPCVLSLEWPYYFTSCTQRKTKDSRVMTPFSTGNRYATDNLFIRFLFGIKDLVLKAFELSTNNGLTKFIVTCCKSVQ